MLLNNISYNNLVNKDRISTYQDMISNYYDELHIKLFNLANKAAYNSFYNAFTSNNQEININNIDTNIDTNTDTNTDTKRINIIKNLVNSGLIDTYDDFKKYINIIEIKNTDYNLPSAVIWKTKTYPFIILSVKDSSISKKPTEFWNGSPGIMRLDDWWLDSIDQLQNKNIINDFNKNLTGFEIKYINYVKDRVIIYNRLQNAYMTIKVSEIPADMQFSDDYSLENTFTSLHK